MFSHCRYLVPLVASAAFSPTAVAPALAFDDRAFCVAAEQLALAGTKDVGLWIDRMTRNAGSAVFCNTKVVEFKRFTYVPSAAMSPIWRVRKAEEWNAVHCSNNIWSDAIRNGWQISLTLSAADGGRVSLTAQCK
jgi:hypothetical protein